MSGDGDWLDPSLEIDPELAKNIGWFMLNWGALEHTVDMLFPVVFRIDPTLAICITANLGTKPKVEMLQSALAMVSPLLPAKPLAMTQEGLSKTLDMSSKYRNLIAHGRPIFAREDDGEPAWYWGRFAARKQLSMLVPNNSADEWEQRAQALEIISIALFESTQALHAAITKIPDEAWEETCLIRDTKR